MSLRLNDVALFNPLSLEFRTNPYPFYDWLRLNDPIHWIESKQFRGWVVTRYKDVFAIFRDERFEKRIAIPQHQDVLGSYVNLQKNMMLFQNPPEHTRLRSVVHKVFTSRITEELQMYIKETANYLLDRVQGSRSLDIISDFAFPLPVLIIARMLGVPMEHREQFRDWANLVICSIDLTRTDKELNFGGRACEQLIEYFQHLIQQRRRHPEDDLISDLVAVEEKGDKLNEDELLATCILLLIAGHETTVNLIGNGVLALLQNPSQFAMLKENPALAAGAVEEVLRYESPTQMTVRFAAEDVEIDGTTIRQGDQVNVFMGSANRDSEQFPRADEFDIIRFPNRHLAFGTGSHFCLGAYLARTEGQIALNTLIRRLPNLELQVNANAPKWRELIGFRGLKELFVSFSDEVKLFV